MKILSHSWKDHWSSKYLQKFETCARATLPEPQIKWYIKWSGRNKSSTWKMSLMPRADKEKGKKN